MTGIHVKFEVSPDQFLLDLTQATYKVALKHGFTAPFVEVELDLYEAIRQIIQKDMMAYPACGQEKCRAMSHYEIASREGAELLRGELQWTQAE